MNVILALAQGGHHDGDCAEPVVQILAELALLDGIHEVDIRCGYDSDIGFKDLRGADTDEFAGLKHPQELGLGCKREFSDFIEEESAPVGLLEISATHLDGPGEGALFMSKKFRVDSAFRDGSAVDGEVLSCPPEAELVYYVGDILLSYSALSGDENGQVRGCDGDGDFQRPVEGRVVSDYVEAVF